MGASQSLQSVSPGGVLAAGGGGTKKEGKQDKTTLLATNPPETANFIVYTGNASVEKLGEFVNWTDKIPTKATYVIVLPSTQLTHFYSTRAQWYELENVNTTKNLESVAAKNEKAKDEKDKKDKKDKKDDENIEEDEDTEDEDTEDEEGDGVGGVVEEKDRDKEEKNDKRKFLTRCKMTQTQKGETMTVKTVATIHTILVLPSVTPVVDDIITIDDEASFRLLLSGLQLDRDRTKYSYKVYLRVLFPSAKNDTVTPAPEDLNRDQVILNLKDKKFDPLASNTIGKFHTAKVVSFDGQPSSWVSFGVLRSAIVNEFTPKRFCLVQIELTAQVSKSVLASAIYTATLQTNYVIFIHNQNVQLKAMIDRVMEALRIVGQPISKDAIAFHSSIKDKDDTVLLDNVSVYVDANKRKGDSYILINPVKDNYRFFTFSQSKSVITSTRTRPFFVKGFSKTSVTEIHVPSSDTSIQLSGEVNSQLWFGTYNVGSDNHAFLPRLIIALQAVKNRSTIFAGKPMVLGILNVKAEDQPRITQLMDQQMAKKIQIIRGSDSYAQNYFLLLNNPEQSANMRLYFQMDKVTPVGDFDVIFSANGSYKKTSNVNFQKVESPLTHTSMAQSWSVTSISTDLPNYSTEVGQNEAIVFVYYNTTFQHLFGLIRGIIAYRKERDAKKPIYIGAVMASDQCKNENTFKTNIYQAQFCSIYGSKFVENDNFYIWFGIERDKTVLQPPLTVSEVGSNCLLAQIPEINPKEDHKVVPNSTAALMALGPYKAGSMITVDSANIKSNIWKNAFFGIFAIPAGSNEKKFTCKIKNRVNDVTLLLLPKKATSNISRMAYYQDGLVFRDLKSPTGLVPKVVLCRAVSMVPPVSMENVKLTLDMIHITAGIDCCDIVFVPPIVNDTKFKNSEMERAQYLTQMFKNLNNFFTTNQANVPNYKVLICIRKADDVKDKKGSEYAAIKKEWAEKFHSVTISNNWNGYFFSTAGAKDITPSSSATGAFVKFNSKPIITIHEEIQENFVQALKYVHVQVPNELSLKDMTFYLQPSKMKGVEYFRTSLDHYTALRITIAEKGGLHEHNAEVMNYYDNMNQVGLSKYVFYCLTDLTVDDALRASCSIPKAILVLNKQTPSNVICLLEMSNRYSSSLIKFANLPKVLGSSLTASDNNTLVYLGTQVGVTIKDRVISTGGKKGVHISASDSVTQKRTLPDSTENAALIYLLNGEVAIEMRSSFKDDYILRQDNVMYLQRKIEVISWANRVDNLITMINMFKQTNSKTNLVNFIHLTDVSIDEVHNLRILMQEEAMTGLIVIAQLTHDITSRMLKNAIFNKFCAILYDDTYYGIDLNEISIGNNKKEDLEIVVSWKKVDKNTSLKVALVRANVEELPVTSLTGQWRIIFATKQYRHFVLVNNNSYAYCLSHAGVTTELYNMTNISGTFLPRFQHYWSGTNNVAVVSTMWLVTLKLSNEHFVSPSRIHLASCFVLKGKALADASILASIIRQYEYNMVLGNFKRVPIIVVGNMEKWQHSSIDLGGITFYDTFLPESNSLIHVWQQENRWQSLTHQVQGVNYKLWRWLPNPSVILSEDGLFPKDSIDSLLTMTEALSVIYPNEISDNSGGWYKVAYNTVIELYHLYDKKQ